MWFNHKTVIFGHSKRQSKKAGKSAIKRERAAGMAARASITDMMIHESRFVGYRGETFA